jgi:hypothetical protein
MGTREPPAYDSAYDAHTSAVRTDGDHSVRRARISRDDAFRVLQDDRRRAVLRFLLAERTDDPTPLSALAAFVAAVRCDDGESAAVGEVQKRVRVALHHSHLPMLADHGLVTYDHATRTVEPKPLLAALDPFLEDGLGAECDLTVGPDREGRGLGDAR